MELAHIHATHQRPNGANTAQAANRRAPVRNVTALQGSAQASAPGTLQRGDKYLVKLKAGGASATGDALAGGGEDEGGSRVRQRLLALRERLADVRKTDGGQAAGALGGIFSSIGGK